MWPADLFGMLALVACFALLALASARTPFEDDGDTAEARPETLVRDERVH